MFPVGFGLRRELLCKPAIEAAIYRPDGLAFTRERVKNGFLGQWGTELHQFQAEKATAAQELRRLETQYARVAEVLKSTPQTKTINDSTVPRGSARWGWWGLAMALVILSLLAITNAASYFRFETQGWFIAFLMAAPLLFVSLPVKFLQGKLTEPARWRTGWILAGLGIVAFVVFVFTLSVRANPPSTSEILDGTARLGTGVLPWQLASQIVLEVVIAAALWCWLLELMISPAKLVPNPDAEMLNARMATLNVAMEPVRTRLSRAEGALQEFSDSLQYWIKLAETIFLAHQEQERRLAERVAALDAWPNV